VLEVRRSAIGIDGSRRADRAPWCSRRAPWLVARGEFFDVHGEFFEGGGSQKTAGFVKARAFARFHTLDVLQNSYGSTWNKPLPPGRKKPPRLINLSTRAKICAKFFSMDPE